MRKLCVIESIKVCNNKKSESRHAGFIRRAFHFQRSVTHTWRNGGHTPCAQEIVPPVSPDDERTNVGAAKNMVSLLILRGILILLNAEGAKGMLSELKLHNDYKSKWVMLVGDGLTQIRVKKLIIGRFIFV